MKKYNGYDELSDRKQMQHWAGSKKFHDDNDKRIAELEKEKEEKEKRKAKDFKNTTPCYMKPSSAKSTRKKVNENSVIKLNENTLKKIVAESVKKVLNEKITGFNCNGEPCGEVEDYEKDFAESRTLSHRVNKALYDLMEFFKKHGDENSAKTLENYRKEVNDMTEKLSTAFYEKTYFNGN